MKIKKKIPARKRWADFWRDMYFEKNLLPLKKWQKWLEGK